VLDVEAEFKGRPQAAEELCRRIRDALGPGYPLYFSSFAIARYHRSFPFEAFRGYCDGAAPQVYWNAFRWPVEQSLGWMYEDYAAVGILPERTFPVGGLYQEGTTRYPPPEEVRAFMRLAGGRGSPGASFWSYEHMSADLPAGQAGMWQAVTSAGGAGEEEEMSSSEFQQVGAWVSALAGRVQRLEEQVRALVTAPATPGAPPRRTYTVQPGDTLSGIAAKLGLGGWQRLYDANRGVIGGDPNRIYPGQVLVVP
jgi:LysM repeat protein